MDHSEWTQALLPLLTLAQQAEREGQYSIAKLARAGVDALGRRAAYQHETHLTREQQVAEMRQIAATLSGLGVEPELSAALCNGADALSEGRLSMIAETPHPYVCRTCGHVVLGAVQEKCPTCGAWPDTFQWFAPIYWLDALDPPAALETLRHTPEEVSALIVGRSDEALTRKPADGGWDVRTILTHLRDAQGVLGYRLELFLETEHPVLESQAVFEWADRVEEKPPGAAEIFAAYRATRAELLRTLAALPLLDWWRTGWHEEFGEVSLKQQVSYFTAHERTHLPQIARLVEAV